MWFLSGPSQSKEDQREEWLTSLALIPHCRQLFSTRKEEICFSIHDLQSDAVEVMTEFLCCWDLWLWQWAWTSLLAGRDTWDRASSPLTGCDSQSTRVIWARWTMIRSHWQTAHWTEGRILYPCYWVFVTVGHSIFLWPVDNWHSRWFTFHQSGRDWEFLHKTSTEAFVFLLALLWQQDKSPDQLKGGTAI